MAIPREIEDVEEDVELSLLGEDERRQAGQGLEDDVLPPRSAGKKPMSTKDKRAMVLLCILCSIPFLLKEHLSYSQLATFALSSYPYSLKLLWSPIVDSVFFKSVGRRKSWIIPMQLIVGTLMLYISLNVQKLMDDPANNVTELTIVFTSLVLFSATQGWALTLLSQDSLSYASTCQTIGLNTGFFASFTVFLALNSESFAEKWGFPRLTLSAYLKFWSAICYMVTFWLLFFKKEDKEPASEADMSITGVYKTIWSICKLKHVQLLIIMHFFAKIGFAANDAATSLKMIEKGFKREDLAAAVLIDFPFQILGGWLTASWSRGDRPLKPWIWAFWPRLGLGLVATLIVYWFPTPPYSFGFFAFIVVHTVLSSFSSYSHIAEAFEYLYQHGRNLAKMVRLDFAFCHFDYLRNLKGVDLFSVATCHVTESGVELAVQASECVSEHGKALCKDINGECITETDGYYVVSAICMLFGLVFLVAFIIPTARKLQVSTLHKMSTTTMHFGPEWMRPKQQSISRPQQPPSPPPANPPSSAMSTYSALVSPAPPNQVEAHDEVHPFRYSKDELLRIYKEGGGKVGLGLEVERWEGVVREHGSDPVGLREMGEAEKKLFAGPLNSDIRRRQSTDYLSPLSTANLGSGGPRLNHNSAAVGSPMRERFGSIKRRDSTTDSPNPGLPKKQSLSSLQAPAMSPRELGQPSPRTRVGYTPGFDGVLSGGDSWVARRRASEASQKPGGYPFGVSGDSDIGERAERIKEEKEEENSGRPAHNSPPGAHDNRPSSTNGVGGSQNAINVGNLAGGFGQLSLNTNLSNPVDNVQSFSSVGAPPGLVDPARVEWSYKDPTGTIQGPFSAELMQKWFDDGFFTPDLPVRRTHLDTIWSTLEQLRRRSATDRIFLTPLQSAPPGLSLRTDSPLQYNAPDQIMNGPYQPAPIRSLRTSTLESYISTGSNHSDSPSSSFGGARFGDSSPEPNAFGGRAAGSQFFNGDPSGSARSSGFQTTPEIPAAFPGRRIPHSDSPVDGSLGMRSGGALGGYGFASPFGAQSPWGAPSNNFGSTYDAAGPSRDAQEHPGLQNLGNQGLGINYGGMRSSQDPIVDSSHPPSLNYAGPDQSSNVLAGDHQYGGFNIGPGAGDQLYAHVAQHQPTFIPQGGVPTHQNSALSQHSLWPDATEANLRRHAPLDNNQPTVANTTAQTFPTPSEISPWDQSAQPSSIPSVPEDSSPWVVATHGAVDSAWGESAEAVPAVDKVEGEVKAQQSPVDQVPLSASSEVMEEAKQVVETLESTPVPPVTEKLPPGKSRKQKESKTVPAPQPLQPEGASPQVPASKPVWQKEEEVKKTISLREIQEAEAKKAEAKKAAERETQRAARAAAASSQDKEDLQVFTTSWGLPTSQAGSRGGSLPTKEAASPPPAPSGTTPVWTNAPKIVPTKKTMKEILEEEEKRKKVTPQVTAAATVAASGSRRVYAEASAKPPAALASGGAWTTVGPSGKSNPVVAAVLPARPIASTASTTSRPNGPATARPAQPPVTKPASALAPRMEDATPSREFLGWLNDSLKGLSNSVSVSIDAFPLVEEIMNMLLSFPVEADAGIREIISEIIYTNSTTMDGRRFADEFVSKRKADVIAHAKNGSSSKTPAKPVSIADVVKAAPKATQPEWGFKVVNKKKKGGRS
ncbi:hypothetical protein D9756_004015 [Leucocoprinus leucothites]|uniref:GYF domain-containing protein n=1 Tax=Leucocoprinus leucothites TaxID=201217 RepID=A0A8H5G038_9AGAR|nr:hypothetical protein D9756_004015 [Leucoagaricus leucothites]